MRLTRDLVLPALICLAEITWLSLWLRVAISNGEGGPLLPILSLFAASLAAALVMRVATTGVWSLSKVRIVALGGAVPAAILLVLVSYGTGWVEKAGPFFQDPLFVSAPPALAAVVGVWFFWWRGIRIGDKILDISAVEEEFRIGTIGLLLVAFVAPLVVAGREPSPVIADVPVNAILFIGTGLLALALSRLRVIQRSGAAGAGTAPRWLAYTLAGIGIIIVSGLGIMAVMPGSMSIFSRLLRPFLFIGSLLEPVLYILLYPIALLVQWLATWWTGLLMAIGLINRQNLQPIEGDPNASIEQAVKNALPASVITTIEWILVGSAIAAIVIVIATLIIRRRKPNEETETDERESVWSWQKAVIAFRTWLGSLFARFRPKVVPGPISDIGLSTAEARTAREIYRSFLETAAQAGLARPAGQTPYEFLSVVHKELADGPDEARTITDVYVKARYAERPPSGSELTASQGAWRTFKMVLHDRISLLRSTRKGIAP